MSLYNILFGVNDYALVLLKVLGFEETSQIPRFRDCFLKNNTIVIYTRTGGGNRDYYENIQSCKQNYPEYFTGKEKVPTGPWNDDLRVNPCYLTDVDDDYDCTYANFFFKFPDEFKQDLEALSKKEENYMPSEKWKLLFEACRKLTHHARNKMIFSLLHPMCLVCNKKVDHWESQQNFFTRKIAFLASCHGEEELHEYEPEFLLQIDIKNTESVAFNKRKLAGQKYLADRMREE